MPSSRITRHGSGFCLDVSGEKLPLYGYLTYQPEKGFYEAFKQAGVRLFFCTVYAGDRGINQLSGIRPFRSGFWKGYGQYDFSEPDADLTRIAGDSKPGEIFIILRVMTEAPSWWDAQNPEELCRDAHGTPLHQSFCSEKWLTDTEEMLSALWRWLKESGWDRYVVGWHMAAGNTEEFIRPCHRAGQMTDYSPCALRAYRVWLRKRYPEGISALNRAWGSSETDFDAIILPNPAKRLYGLQGDLRDPKAEHETVDYYAFQNESLALAVNRLCAAAKRASGRQLVIGAFYGYLSLDAESGQHAASLVFNCPDVDFIASPFVYTDSRGSDIDWEFQGSVASAALHGKPWFMEADIRTFLSRPLSKCMPKADPFVSRAYDGPVWWGPDTAAASLGQMLKAFARVLTHNTAIWWFDMWGGWYNDPALMAFHQKAFRLYREQFDTADAECAAEIALFMDDRTFERVLPASPLNSLVSTELWKRLGYIGAPYRVYMLEDIPLVRPEAFKMAIFSSVCGWNDTLLTALGPWKSQGRVLAFFGPTDAEAASGIAVKTVGMPEELPANQQCGSVRTPCLRLDARAGDVVLDADEQGALCLLRRARDYSVYAGIPVLPETKRVRELLNAAGGQLITCGGDIAYAGGTHLALHAVTDGVKRIHIPGKARLRDEMTGKLLPGNESFVDVKMKKGETLLLKMEPIGLPDRTSNASE